MKCIWSRRDFLFQSGGGMSGLALAYLLSQEGLLGAAPAGGACDAKAGGYNPYAPRKPHFSPRATSGISLFLSCGGSPLAPFPPNPAPQNNAGAPLSRPRVAC